ncbi:MAG TPA: glycerol-3-phosphate dehydrogenase/oxidase [Polyangiaceae bacterium]|jgi:glycerol-3-phosphate dehydrogenase|nr:glycerol-3-phosphate dehydrogenase/oxidase [Polyangiaceae bacterium]
MSAEQALVPSVPPAGPMPVAREALPPDEVDVVVIGGGVNGTGVARDLSLRGLRVALFERNDLAYGASGNSSGMIHGGARYLLQSPQVTASSSRDSGYIQRIAPHLLFRIPFLMPLKGGAGGRIMLELTEAYFRAYDDYQPLKRGEAHCRLDAADMARIEPGLVGAHVGGITFDEWGVDGGRLCVLAAIDALEHGARVHLHTTVESVERATPPDASGAGAPGAAPYVVTARHRMTDEVTRVRARVVVNATGAWGPITAGLANVGQARARVRPGKGIHIVLDRRVTNYAILSEAIDGRQVFVYPWQNLSLVGTTDDDYYGDLDDVRATSEEVRYLVQGVAKVFPAVRQARAIGTYAGVRPTLYDYGPTEDALDRDHRIVDHAADGAPGVYSMIGGKLASYRMFAQELSDLVAPRHFDLNVPCSTHERPLPGGDRVPDALALAEAHGVTPVCARRLVYRHGSRAHLVFERAARVPTEHDVVCPCEPVLEAEVRHVVREEMARTVDDVARRTRLGLGACGGMRCAARCGQIVAEELGIAPAEGRTMAVDFLVRQARTRVVALGPEQARQEALTLAHVRASLGEAR